MRLDPRTLAREAAGGAAMLLNPVGEESLGGYRVVTARLRRGCGAIAARLRRGYLAVTCR